MIEFRIAQRGQWDVAIVAAGGELDLASSDALESELERATASEAEVVIVDLREVRFMDASILGLLVRAQQSAAGRNQRFGVVNGGEKVRSLLRLANTGEALNVVNAPEDLLHRSG